MNWSKLAALIVRLRWFSIVVFTAITAFFAYQIPKSQFDTELKNQLPEDLPTRVNLAKIEKLFGGTDMIMVLMSSDDIVKAATLERIQTLTEKMQKLPELERVVSLATSKDLHVDEMGDMIVEPAVAQMPKTDEDAKQLKARLEKNPLAYGNLISKDFKHAVLLAFIKPNSSDEDVVGKLEALVKEVPGPEETLVGGMPVTRVKLTHDMRKDMRWLLPIGLVLMLLFLLLCFRQARGVLLPFTMTVMSIVVTMGIIPLLGWKIHTVTILLPVIMLAVANNYGIHVLARYQEDNVPNLKTTSRELAISGIEALARPVLATGLTTIVGMLCLLSHIIVPAKQLGVLAGIGVAFAMIGTLIFIPSVLAVLPRGKPVLDPEARKKKGKRARSLLEGVLTASAGWVARKPRTILIASLVVTAVMGFGATRVVVDTNPMSFYRKTDPIWRSTHILNQSLGGWAGISVVVEGDIKDPKVLQAMDDLEQHLRKHPKVGMTTSFAGIMRKMNQLMNEGDPKFDKIPETRELVAQYLLLYSMAADSADFEKWVDFPYQHAQIMAKVTDAGTRAATDVVEYTKAYIAKEQDPSKWLVGGFLDVMADMVDHIVWGQVVSMGLAAILVCILVGILMRSVVCGLLAGFPLALALTGIFGVMGFAGIELNLVTALLSSIMIGVGVDYTIHFLWRYRSERQIGFKPPKAVERTLTTTGRGIVFNALSVVVGFSVLVISSFFPVQFFGILVAISILASLAGALVVLPALVVIIKPKSLEPSEQSRGGPSPTGQPPGGFGGSIWPGRVHVEQ